MMVNDVIEHTRLQTKGLGSPAEVCDAGKRLAGFSPALAEAERGLKNFMYERLYFHPDQICAAEKARNVVARLFVAYSQDSSLMPAEWQADLPTRSEERRVGKEWVRTGRS